MANRRITYDIGFNANTEQLKQQLRSVSQELQGLGNKSYLGYLTTELNAAKDAALELDRRLQNATSSTTGKLNVAKFAQDLSRSGTSLRHFKDELVKLGPEGAAAFERVTDAIVRSEVPLRRSGALVEKFMVTLGNTVRWQIANAAINTFTQSLSSAYSYTKNLDSSLNSIRIVTSKNADEMARFAKQANAAAKALSTTTTAYTDASLIYYQQGLNDEEVKARTDVTVKMANVTGDAADEVSQQLTAVWNNFAEGSDNLELFADKMVALGAATASSSSEIAGGVQQFAAVAKTVGMSYDYAVTALATLTAKTRQSETVVGNGLRTLLSRFESLKLGDTLEDGVELTKYSAALQTVGVNVLDLQGQMKDFDDVLDDTAAVWGTLDQTQKVALATTVGGVRQYAMFISLMDSMQGTFQENLKVAQNAGGALQEQSDIYAEGWEAARDRVKAAAEDVYDSLLNKDMFIGLDDAFTPILTGLAKVIDAAGGLPGVAAAIIPLINLLSKTAVVNVVDKLGNAMGMMTGSEQRAVINMQKEAAQLQVEAMRVRTYAIRQREASELTQGKEALSIQQKSTALHQEAATIMESLSHKQRELLQDDMDGLRVQQRKLAALQDQVIATDELKKKERENVRGQISTTVEGMERNTVAENMDIMARNTQDFGRWKTKAAALSDTVKRVDNTQALTLMSKELEAAAEKAHKFARIQATLESSTALSTERMATLRQELREVDISFQNLSDEEIDKIFANIGNESSDAYNYLQRLVQVMDACGVETADFVRSIENGRLSEDELKDKINELNRALDEQKQKLADAAYSQMGWAEKTTAVINTISSAAMAISSFSSAVRTCSDDSTSLADKITTVAMTLGFVAPAAISAGRAIKAGFQEGASGAALFNAALGWISVAFTAITAAIILINNAIKKHKEEIEEATHAYEKWKEEMASLEDEFNTNKERIKELQALKNKGTISYAEQNELDNLIEVNAQLALKKKQLEEIEEQKKQETNQGLIDTLNSESSSSNSYQNEYWASYDTSLNNLDKDSLSGFEQDNLDIIESTLSERRDKIEEFLSSIIGESLTEDMQNYVDQITEELYGIYKIQGDLEAETQQRLTSFVPKMLKYADKDGKVSVSQLDKARKEIDGLDKEIEALIGNGADKNKLALFFSNTNKELGLTNEKLTNFVGHINELKNGEEATEKIGKVLYEFNTNGYASADSIQGLEKDFGDLGEAYNNFIQVMGSSKSTQAEAQQASNELAEAYLNTHVNLNNLTDSEKDYVTNLLTKMGVTNASEVVERRLIKAQIDANVAAGEGINAQILATQAAIRTSGATETLTTKLELLKLEQLKQKSASIDAANASKSQIASFISLAAGVDLVTKSMARYQKLMYLKAKYPKGEMTEEDAAFIDEYEKNGFEADYNDVMASIDEKINGLVSTSVKPVVTGSSKSSSSKDKTADRYQLINKRLETQSNLIDELGTKMDRVYGTKKLDLYEEKLKALNHQRDLELQKLKEAKNYRDQVDIPALTQLGVKLVRDTDGEIDFEKTEQQYLKSDNYDKIKDALDLYKNSLDTIEEQTQALIKLDREMFDQRINRMDDTLDWMKNSKKLRDTKLDLQKTIAESFGDALTHGMEVADIQGEQALQYRRILYDYDDMKKGLLNELANATSATDEEAIRQRLADLESDYADASKNLIQIAEAMEEVIPNAVKAASERFNEFISELSHNNTVMQAIKDLYALQGQTYRTAAGYNNLQSAAQAKLDNTVKQAKMQRAQMERVEASLNDASSALDAFKAANKDYEHTTGYDQLKAEYDALLEEYNSTQEAMLEGAKSAIEQAKDIFTLAMEKAVYDFGQTLSEGTGLDLLQEKYDHYIDTEERYFDAVNEAYQTAAWYNKLQKDINDATQSRHRDELIALQQEIDIRRENGTLNQYDLDILEAKYNVLKAQADLEDAQNAKKDLRLTRDSAGNWNYQYSADQDGILDAENALGKAQTDYYNIAKQQVKDVTSQIVKNWQDCQQEIDEMYKEMGDNLEEAQEKEAEIREYYSQKAQDLEREKLVAIQDMNQAGSEAIDNFSNTYAEALSGMTETNSEFGRVLDETLDESNANFEAYRDTVHEVAEETGTDLSDLETILYKVETATNKAYEAGQQAAEDAWKIVEANQQVRDSYLEIAQAAMQAAQAQGMSGVDATTIADATNGVDISDLIAYGLKSGQISMGDSNYNTLKQLRSDKIDVLGLQDKYSDNTDEYLATRSTSYSNWDEWYKDLHSLVLALGLPVKLATGGYTGDFDGGKLAILHEKELVLNQQDTDNMLAAVSLVRSIPTETLRAIEQSLDGSAKGVFALLAQGLGSGVAPSSGVLEQHVTIEHVEFPNVTSSHEIEEAFASLANDAAQWARIR